MLIKKKKQHGFSMVEVLVSLLVIGVGLLGLSGLQIASVKGSNNAHARNTATNLAMELSERMRANEQGVQGGFYENNVTCTTNTGNQCKGTVFCTPEQSARIDVQEVMCGVLRSGQREGGAANLLPRGTLVVDHDSNCDLNVQSQNETTITVSWSELQQHKNQTLANNGISSVSICVIP